MNDVAAARAPGANGLVALDWWNGNRSVLVDGELSGLLVGMTLETDAVDIYRALLESTAYGMREVVEAFVRSGVGISVVHMSGGISRKSPLLMQIYADVLGRPVHASQTELGPALGSAIYGAVASGAHSSIGEAAEAMGDRHEIVYEPAEHGREVYDELYSEFSTLHDYFGRGQNEVMKRLRRIRAAVR